MATVTGTKRHLGITSDTYDSNGDVVVGGNLTVEGTTTTLDTANLLVEDKNIIIGNVSTPSDTTADGGGITLKGASDYTINWVNANDRWEFNQGIHSTGNITGANLSGTNTGDNSANTHSNLFIDRGTIDVTTSSGGSNANPFDDAHTETKVAENGMRTLNYTGASAFMYTFNNGGSASVVQIGAHYNGNDFYMRTRIDSSNWQDWRKLYHNNNDDGILNSNVTLTSLGAAAALTSDQNYVTDAQLVVIGNTSGTNTGDQTLPTDFVSAASGGTFSAGITISNTFPFLDFVDTNSFTDADDRFRVRAGANQGLMQWYDASAGSTQTIMSLNPDGDVDIVGDLTADNFSGTSSGTNTGDQDTTYTAGNGLSLSGTEFRMAGGSIGGSVDLDTYTGSGYYVQGSNAYAASGTNWPVDKAGILTVVRAEGNTTHITQTYDQYNSNAFYNRSYYNGTWSSWRNLAQDTNTQRAISSTPTDGATTTSISSDWAFDNVKTAVPANALFTDTTYNLSGYLLNTTDTLTGNLTINTGGLIIEGSVDSGATNMGYYESAGTNIILKGDSVGRSGIFFESEKDGTNINDPSDYGFIQFHSYGYGNTTGEANNLVIGVSNDSTDKVILQAPYNGGVMIGYKDATSGTGLTLSEVIHSNATSYNNANWDAAYTHAGSTHAPTNAEQNVQSDWNATSGDALILNKPSIPAASGKGQNINYIASNLPSSNSTYRDNFGAGVWAYSGYSTGTDRPFTYDATLQVMPTAAFGFELSTSWHSTGEGSLKIRALRDCCEGWGDYHDVWTSDNFANNSANWDAAYGYGDHAAAGYVDDDSYLLKSNADDTFTGRLSVGSTDSRRAGIYGYYDSNKTGHIWSMGTGYMIPSNGSDFGNLYGLAYKHTNNTTGGTMAGGHQMVWCANGTGKSAIGDNIWTSGNVTHSGLTMTDGTDIDQIKSYTKSLILTTNWIDTGVNGSELATGTYIIQVSVNNSGANGQQYNEMYSGTMSWYADNTNSTNHDELVLHAAGHARNDKSIFLRIQRTVGSDTNDLKLQISSNHNATQTASNYIFKFRRMI
jgi:hypothetical protein